MSNRLRRLAVVWTMVVMTTWGPSPVRSGVGAAAAARLTDLRGVDELRTLFNRDQGKFRLVLLVSPT
jgi:hypothetical protein